MNQFISLYRPRFVLSLGYMLQSVEYNVSQYLKWFWRQPDFSSLQGRRVKPSPKSRLLVVLAGLIYLFMVGLTLWSWINWWNTRQLVDLWLALGAIALIPAAVSHLLVVPLLIGTWLVQKPLEWLQANRTRQIFAAHPAKVIVIAGSYGKTSMKHLLKAVLGAKLDVAVTLGNYNTPAGINRFARQLSGQEDILIIEAGEYKPGDVAHICRLVGPDIGFITGVNEQHLLRMKSVANALKTVFEVADYLDGGQPLYVNGESDYVQERITDGMLVYNRSGVGNLKVSKLSSGLSGSHLTVKLGKARGYTLKTSLMGLHQAGPLAAAAHLAHNLGLKPTDIKKGIADLEAHERRFKPQTIGDVTVIDDSYNGNPDGFLAGMDFLDGLKDIKRRVYVTPGMVELGRMSDDIHFALGQRLANSHIDQIILYANPATSQIKQGLDDGHYTGEVQWLSTQANFLEHLGDYTRSGDVVLLQNSPREDFFYL